MPPKGSKIIKKEPGVIAATEPPAMATAETSVTVPRPSNNPAGRPPQLENKFLSQKVKDVLKSFLTTMDTLLSLDLSEEKLHEAFSKIALGKFTGDFTAAELSDLSTYCTSKMSEAKTAQQAARQQMESCPTRILGGYSGGMTQVATEILMVR